MRRLSLRARILIVAITLLVTGMVASDAVVLVALRKPLVERVDLQVTIAAGAMTILPESFLRTLQENAPAAVNPPPTACTSPTSPPTGTQPCPHTAPRRPHCPLWTVRR